MAERVYPSTKPVASSANGSGAGGGNGVAAQPPPQTVPPPPGAAKPLIYNPNRPPYRPQQYGHSRRARRKFCTCCCCLFWSILLILILALIAAIAAAAFWVLYRPHTPTFSVFNFRVATLNLTTTADATHLTSAINLTLSTTNPNNKITFLYDDVSFSVLSSSGVVIANATSPPFTSSPNEFKTMKLQLRNGADLEAEEARRLKSDLRKKRVAMSVKAETSVRVKIGKLKTNRVIIRVICEGIRGSVPTGKTPTVASTADSKCRVRFRLKIWRFTF